MKKEDRELLNKIISNKSKYYISVDNDCIIVNEKNPYNREKEVEKWEKFEENDNYEEFSAYGSEFIIEILKFLGLDADYC